MSYTVAALVGVAAALALDLVVLRTRLVTRKSFWVAYAIIVTFQLVSNAVLTCRGVVTYRTAVIIGLRIACAPVEDLLFGFSLVLQTLVWWVWWGRRSGAGRSGAGRSGAGRRGPGRSGAGRS